MSKNFNAVAAPEPWCREVTFSLWAFVLGFSLFVGIFFLVQDRFPADKEETPRQVVGSEPTEEK